MFSWQGYCQAMSEEPMTPDLVELVQRFSEALGQRDADAAMSLLAPDFVHRPIATFTDSQERGVDAFRRSSPGGHPAN
jgi:hypothetical protein